MDLTTLRKDARAKATGDSANAQFTDDDCDRYLNQYYRKAGEIAVDNGGDWDAFGEIVTLDIVEDSGNTGFIQQEYMLTDDLDPNSKKVYLRRILRVFMKTVATDDYTRAKKTDISSLEQDFAEYNPASFEYDLMEDSIFILLPDYTYTATITAGIKLYIQTDIKALESAGDIPQLPTVLQNYLSIGAAFEYCQDRNMFSKADRLEKRLMQLESEIGQHFSNRHSDKQNQMIPAEELEY